MTSVSSQVESLSNTVAGIISALTMLGERGKSLEADLMSAQSQLDSITAALEGVVTSEELGLISNTSADIQADALICADMGVLDYATQTHPNLNLHLSVQGSGTNAESLSFYKRNFKFVRRNFKQNKLLL